MHQLFNLDLPVESYRSIQGICAAVRLTIHCVHSEIIKVVVAIVHATSIACVVVGCCCAKEPMGCCFLSATALSFVPT